MEFAGFILSEQGILPDPAKTEAIRKFPTPTNLSELRSFLGLANQFSSYIPDLAIATNPLRELLKKKNAFLWTYHHTEALEQAKKILSSHHLIVKPFNPALRTELVL